MSKFTDRLWRELVREHGADLADTSRPGAKPPRWTRPRLVLGSTVGVAGVATTLALALGAASSAPAFAVTRNHDGTVTVKVMRAAGIAGANARLTQLGVRAKVVQVAAGCPAPAAMAAMHPQALAKARAVVHAQVLQQAKISPRRIPAGRTLVIATWRAGRGVAVAPGYMARGVAPDCLPPVAVTCRAGGPPPGGNSGNSGNSGSSENSGPATAKAPSGPPALTKALKLRALAKAQRVQVIGNSGNSGNSGKGGPPPIGTGPIPGARLQQVRVWCSPRQPPPGSSGNSGNSGKSGNSGNSGS